MTDVWERLALYESTDLVTRFYEEHHERRLTDQKATEIVCQLVQGREYFASAARSAEVVHPLLLYYGVLSLSRGLILFLNPGIREAGLGGGHGLSSVQWNQRLAQGIRELPNLEVRLQRGTFSELSKATGNHENVMIFREPYPNTALWRTEGTGDVPAGATITLKDVLSRIPDVQEVFERSLGHHSHCYPALVFMHSVDTCTDVYVYDGSSLGLPDEHYIQEALQIPDGTPLQFADRHDWLGGLKNWHFRVDHGSSSEMARKLPSLRVDSRNRLFAIAPFPHTLSLSTLSCLFLVAYAAGMLVRYYPSHWSAALGRRAGDYSFPLLKAAISVVESRLPELILDELEYRAPQVRRVRLTEGRS